MNLKSRILKYCIIVFLFLLGLSFLFPLVWMINLSFKGKREVFDNPFGLPQKWVFSNYPEALKSYHFFNYFSNSLIYSVLTIIITIIAGSMFAYCVCRMNWKYKNLALNYISLGLIIPVQVVIIPLFILLKQLHLKDSHMSLVFPYAAFALSSCVLMLYAFFRTLPRELEEAACIDGCNVYSSFIRIIFPIMKPALSTQCVLIFMNVWNEFFLGFILASKDTIRPLPVGLMNFFVSIGTTHWGLIGAAMIVSSLPTVIVYLFFNEQIENALTAGAILK